MSMQIGKPVGQAPSLKGFSAGLCNGPDGKLYHVRNPNSFPDGKWFEGIWSKFPHKRRGTDLGKIGAGLMKGLPMPDCWVGSYGSITKGVFKVFCGYVAMMNQARSINQAWPDRLLLPNQGQERCQSEE